MNGPHTPAYVKNNSFTRLMDRVAMLNANEGKPAGRAAAQAAEHFQQAIPAHRLRGMTPGQLRELDHVPDMLSPEESQHANARAAALGIDDDMVPPVAGTLRGGPSTPVTAGDPTDEEIEAMLPQRFRPDPAAAAAAEHVANHPPFTQQANVPSGRPMTAAQGMLAARAMPNFRIIQGFNLEKGVAVVDGIEFPLSDEDVRDMKKFALHVVLDSMVIQVAQALVDIGVPKEMAEKAAQSLRDAAANAAVPGSMADGGRESAATSPSVSEVPRGETTGGVPPVESQTSGLGVPEVREPEAVGEAESFWLLANSEETSPGTTVPDDHSGSSDGSSG